MTHIDLYHLDDALMQRLERDVTSINLMRYMTRHELMIFTDLLIPMLMLINYTVLLDFHTYSIKL